MVKENLETRVIKAVLQIENKVSEIYNVLRDLSLKLCHLIKSKKDYYSVPDENYYQTNS